MPVHNIIPIEDAEGQIDFTIAIKTIVDYVLTHQKGLPEEGLQRVNIKKTVEQIIVIMKKELFKNPMLDLDIRDPQVKEMCRITLTNILVNYGVSRSHLRRVYPYDIKSLKHINLRYRAGLPYSRPNVMIPSSSSSKKKTLETN